jgi:hypothetical protein
MRLLNTPPFPKTFATELTLRRGALNVQLLQVAVDLHYFQFDLLKMLYLVGLGLSNETDITVRGLEIVKRASRVYLEAYTSILLVDQSVLVSGLC